MVIRWPADGFVSTHQRRGPSILQSPIFPLHWLNMVRILALVGRGGYIVGPGSSKIKADANITSASVASHTVRGCRSLHVVVAFV